MARLIGPDEGSRLVYRTSGSTLQRAVGASVEVFSDAGATTPADILTVGGATIVGSAVLTDAYSRIPLFQFPDGVDTVYVVISGGPITAVYARSDDRIDANTALLVGHTAALAALPGTYVPITTGAFGIPTYSEGVFPCTVPTFDGDPNVGHPCVVDLGETSTAWINGYRHWMALTPFPGPTRELPSLVCSKDGVAWVQPPGITNPVVSLAEIVAAGYAYGSDTHLILDSPGVLAFYYRPANSGPTKNAVWRKTYNGTTLSAGVAVVTDAASEVTLLSPAIEKVAAGDYRMWVVDGTVDLARVIRVRTSTDGITFGAASGCTIPAGSMQPWHIDVKYRNNLFYMLVSNTAPGLGNGYRLQVLTSSNGVAFGGSVRQYAVETSGLATDVAGHYRSCLVPAGTEDRWHIYVTGYDSFPSSTANWRIIAHRNAQLPTRRQRERQTTIVTDRLLAKTLVDPWLIGDSGDRADNAASVGSADSGQVWTAQSGTPGIISKGFYAAAGAASCVIDTGKSDVEMSVEFAGTLSEAHIMFRTVDSNNWIRVGYDGNVDGRLIVTKRVAGTITQVGGAHNSFPIRIGDRLIVKAVGTLISFYRNEDFAGSETVAEGVTNTKHGLNMVAGTVRMRNFTCKNLAG